MGTGDQILDIDDVLPKYEAIPGARLVPIDDAYHSPNADQAVIADQILSFVAERAGR